MLAGRGGAGQGKTSANSVKCMSSSSPFVFHGRLSHRSRTLRPTRTAVRGGAPHRLHAQINPNLVQAWWPAGPRSCLHLARIYLGQNYLFVANLGNSARGPKTQGACLSCSCSTEGRTARQHRPTGQNRMQVGRCCRKLRSLTHAIYTQMSSFLDIRRIQVSALPMT